MPNQVRIGVGVTGAKGAASEVDKLRDKFDNLKKQGAKGFGIGVGAAVGVKALGVLDGALAHTVDFFGDSISKASAFNESLGKSQVVFGKNADAVEKWADTSAKGFGISKQAALEAAGTYGNLFQAFGIGADKSQQMSTTLVQLAADLASFNNTSVDDALLALRSGLSGETEPLRRYGIALSDARMREYLMAQGAKNLGATLTPLQKTQAAYALILKDSTLAQGDFTRTSAGLANQQRITSAELDDAQAKLGEKLLPIQLKATQGTALFAEALSDFTVTVEGAGNATGNAISDVYLWATASQRAADQQKAANAQIAESYGDASHAVRVATKDTTEAAAGSAKGAIMMAEAYRTTGYEVGKSMLGIVRVSHEAAKLPSAMASDIEKGRSEWQKAWKDLTTDAEKSLGRFHEIAKTQSLLTSKDMLKGLTSTDPVIRAKWAALHKDLEARLEELRSRTASVSDRTARYLGDAMKKHRKDPGAQATYMKIAIQNALGTLPSQAYGWGLGIGSGISRGIAHSTPTGAHITLTGGGNKSPGGTLQLAEGGIVKARPGGTLALIGEAGQDEAVVPIGKGPTAGKLTAPMGGGSVVMNISLNLPNAYGMSPAQGEAAARAFGPALVKYIADRRIFQRAS